MIKSIEFNSAYFEVNTWTVGHDKPCEAPPHTWVDIRNPPDSKGDLHNATVGLHGWSLVYFHQSRAQTQCKGMFDVQKLLPKHYNEGLVSKTQQEMQSLLGPT